MTFLKKKKKKKHIKGARSNYIVFSYGQMDTTTPNIVGPTMLGVVAY